MYNDQLQLFAGKSLSEDPRFLQDQIITYIGNKRSLLPFIEQAVRQVTARLGRDELTILDLFSGTGVVARFFKRWASKLIVNDLEPYSALTNSCYLTNRSEIDDGELAKHLVWLEKRISQNWAPGLICDLYAPKDEQAITESDRVFYTRRNATYIDTASAAIEELPESLKKYFLGPLLASASVHANTSGVFKGFYKNAKGVGQFGGDARDALARIVRDIHLQLPIRSRFECEYSIHQADANSLVGVLPEVDLAYFDPPYNQHPYGSNYFMLNLILSRKRPQEVSRVSGIPKDWNRSRYNQRAEAEDALFDALSRCAAKFLLISYNSEGFITYDRFIDRLQTCGKVDCLETKYNTFRGSRNLRERDIHVTEYLYLVER